MERLKSDRHLRLRFAHGFLSVDLRSVNVEKVRVYIDPSAPYVSAYSDSGMSLEFEGH